MNAYRDQYAKLFKNGRGVVLIAISADPDTALASWARDSEFPFLLASDTGTVVARRYGALADRAGLTNRNLFVVGPDGRIAYRATPFREVDPTAYSELGTAIDKLVPAERYGGTAVRRYGGTAVRRYGGTAVRRYGGNLEVIARRASAPWHPATSLRATP